MNRVKNFAIVLVVVTVCVLLCLCRVDYVSAGAWFGDSGGSSTGGYGGTGSSCNAQTNRYTIDCAGTSWIYYKASEQTTEDVHFPYLGKIKGEIQNAIIPSECSDPKYGGFWHFGINARKAAVVVSGSEREVWTLNQTDQGHWNTMNRVYSTGQNKTEKPLNQTIGVYYADHYGTDSEVLAAYQEAMRISGSSEIPTFLPNNLWAFCAGDNMSPTYYSKSNVSIKRQEGGYDEWTTTGPVNYSSSGDLVVGDDVFYVGDTAKIAFSHEVFSNVSVEETRYWEIYGKRWGNLWGSSDYSSMDSFPTGDGSDGAKIDYGNGTLTTYRDNLYTTSNSNVRRREYTVKFNNPGTWVYCEKLMFPKGLASVEEIHSQACATINVSPLPPEPENEYFVKSNVGIRDDAGEGNDYKTTGVVKRDGYAESNVVVPVNTVSTIVFSHNVYSDADSGDPSVEVTTPSFGNGAQLMSGGITEACGLKNSKVTQWEGNNSHSENEPADVNYVGNPRNCSDGKWRYISRDVYQVKFTEANKSYTFCEKIKVGGEIKAEVCAKVTVGPRGYPTTSTNICSAWAPGSYNSSLTSETSGVTSVVSKVKDPSSGYSSWANSVYAKPGDTINWVHCYYPGVQHLFNRTVTKDNKHINSSSNPHPTTASNSNLLNNMWFSSAYTWQNQYSISSNNMSSTTSAQKLYTFAFGVTAIQKTEDNEYRVEYGFGKNKAGKTIKEINTSGVPSSVSRSNNGVTHRWSCNKYQCGEYCVKTDKEGNCTKYKPIYCFETCEHDEYYQNSRDTSPAVSSAEVKVPYNFTNTAEITLNGELNDDVGRTVVYAGETTTVQNFKVKVWTRYNSTLNGTYATQVNDAKIQVVTYVSNGNDTSAAMSRVGSGKNQNICSILSGRGRVYDGMCKDNIHAKDNQDFNEEGYINSAHTSYSRTGTTVDVAGNRMVASVDTDTYFSLGASVNVYDVDVSNNSSGDKFFCVVAAVYPNTVVNNTDMDSSGSNDWYISSPKCQKIAKKPTFQILGGGLYSAGDIEASAPVKNNLYGVSNVGGNSYTYNGTGGNTAAFNPWVEQGIVAIGEIDGVTSGAATGLNSSLMYGSFETGGGNYCDRVPLSFANDQCTKQGTTGNIMGGSGGLTGSKNVDNPGAVAEYWLNKVTNPTQKSYSGAIGISDEGNYSVAGSVADVGASTLLRYTYASGNLTLKAATIPNQITHIVKATGNITITDNIGYDKSQEIALLNYIPKLVIYAQGDLNIQCNVTKIDAILIANGKINTCSNISNVNSEGRSVQLTINGAAVARQIEFNRTYGAAAGVNSGVPAEIVNYDVSSILWGRYVAGSSQSNDLTMTYQHELAPRL